MPFGSYRGSRRKGYLHLKYAYYEKVPTWPVYYSDQYGDCTCAAAGHMIQKRTANAATEITPPDQSVLT